MNTFQKIHQAFRRRLDRLVMRRREKKALSQYGWDGSCVGCGRRAHATGCAKLIAETDYHWFYGCDCGTVTPWCLGIAPCPVRNEPQREGWPNWREELENNPDAKARVEAHNARDQARERSAAE